jgi:hypothetical protein
MSSRPGGHASALHCALRAYNRLTRFANDDGKMPDGQISSLSNCGVSSPVDKNISLNPSGKSPLEICPSHPKRGGSRVVTNARWDAVDATASGAQGIAGRVSP